MQGPPRRRPSTLTNTRFGGGRGAVANLRGTGLAIAYNFSTTGRGYQILLGPNSASILTGKNDEGKSSVTLQTLTSSADEGDGGIMTRFNYVFFRGRRDTGRHHSTTANVPRSNLQTYLRAVLPIQ